MQKNTLVAYDEEITRAGSIVARAWPGVIDADDAGQEIRLKVIEEPKLATSLRESDHGQRMNIFVLIGHRVAAQYRSSYEVFSGQVHYGTAEVRNILEGERLTQDYENLGAGTETLSEYLDLVEGVQRLREKSDFYADVVAHHYFLGDPVHRYRVELTRAVDALTECMNRARRKREDEYTEGPGTRTVKKVAYAE